jgi:hypothetical protein
MSATDDQPGPVRGKPPPRQLMKIVNPLMRLIIDSPLGRRMDGMAVLRFKGRRTGKAYTIPVGVHEVDGVFAVFTDRAWRLNCSDGATVSVSRGGRTELARAQLISNPSRVGPALATALRRAGNPRRLGLTIDKGHQPTESELAAVGRSMITLTFDTEPSKR